MPLTITPITLDDADSFRDCLDAVAKEGRYLALLEAPPVENVREFVAHNVEQGLAQVVAREAGKVVGWCDILAPFHHTLQHCGSLGMGLLPAWRGRGLGTQLFNACLERAVAGGITRVELETRVDNAAALKLYARLRFQQEGVKVRGMRVNGEYIDTVAMALLV